MASAGCADPGACSAPVVNAGNERALLGQTLACVQSPQAPVTCSLWSRASRPWLRAGLHLRPRARSAAPGALLAPSQSRPAPLRSRGQPARPWSPPAGCACRQRATPRRRRSRLAPGCSPQLLPPQAVFPMSTQLERRTLSARLTGRRCGWLPQPRSGTSWCPVSLERLARRSLRPGAACRELTCAGSSATGTTLSGYPAASRCTACWTSATKRGRRGTRSCGLGCTRPACSCGLAPT